MVSPELMSELQERFDTLAQSVIEPGNYTGSLFDVAFEITTADTLVAGVASQIIDGHQITQKHKAIVQRPFLLEGRWWQRDDGSVFDLGGNPEINRVALAVEQLRATCATALNLTPYIHMIESFVENKIDVSEFERSYLLMFTNDTSSWTEAEYENLNHLFGEVDAFCTDPELRSENDIDEDQLREAAKMTLAKLLNSDRRL